MAADDWELVDTTTRDVLAVGTMWNCVIARLDVLGPVGGAQVSAGELVVRPHKPRRGTIVQQCPPGLFGRPAR